jgi:hypothetical protein
MPYEFHANLRTPPNDTVLWRYMDFAKFIQMIESKSLWFTRLDQLEDPLEGGHTDAELAKHFVTLLLLTVPISPGRSNFCGHAGNSPPSGITPYLTPSTGCRFRGEEVPIRERGNGSVRTETGETKL